MESEWKKELRKLIVLACKEGKVNELLVELLTPKEYDELSRRWQIVKLLVEENTQRDVRGKLKVAIATVERGMHQLKYGNGTLQKFYDRMYKKRKSGSH